METSSSGATIKKRKTNEECHSRKLTHKVKKLSKSKVKSSNFNILKIKIPKKNKSSCVVASNKKKLKANKKIVVSPQFQPQVIQENCCTASNIEYQSTETTANSQTTPLHDNIVIKQEPLDHDNISNLDLLVPKIELEISENEINTDIVNNSNEYNERLGFKCPFCNVTTEYKSVFQRHLRLANVKIYEITSNNPRELGNTYSCSICKTNFSNQVIYNHHMKTHKSVSCEVCNHSYSYECELVKHQFLKNHNMYCFQCHRCDNCFNTENLLKEHLISFHGTSDIKFVCMLCKTMFNTKYEMLNHSTITFKSEVDINLEDGIFRPFKLNCNPCDAIICSQDSFMIQIGVKKLSKYFCFSCDYQYSSIYYLNQHFVSTHGNLSIQDTNLTNSQVSNISDTLVSTSFDEPNCSTINIENDTMAQQSTDIEQVHIKVEKKDDYLDQINSEHSTFPLHTEFIVPDIKTESVLSDSNHEELIISSSSCQPSHKKRMNSNSILMKKQSKVKTIQLKVNNTTSQICSVNVTNNSTMVPASVNKRLANFFENNVNNLDDSEGTMLASNTISVAPSAHHKKTQDKYWCNACQCSVGSDHIHTDAKIETFKCHKCERIFSSFVAIKMHFKSIHLRRKNHLKVSIRDKCLKRKPRDRKIKYRSTPKNFANPCVETSMVLLQKNCVPKQSAKNCCDEHYFFYCSLCDTVYNKYEVYTDHFSIHDLKRPFFKCVVCDKIFVNFKISLVHFKQHSETKVNCVKCYKDINFNLYFDEHLKTCFSKQCSFCPCEIENIDRLHVHSIRHITEANNVFECKICGGYFYTQCNFQKHFSNYHSDSDTSQELL